MSLGDLSRIFLRDGIHELRVRKGRVNYRVLYFFHGRELAVLAHAITKEREVPDADIDRTVRRRKAFASNPAARTYAEEQEQS
jgi:phage-related protein